MMNLLSLDTATEHIDSMKEDEWQGREKSDGTSMCVGNVVQLLLGLQIEDLSGLVLRNRNDEPTIARYRN